MKKLLLAVGLLLSTVSYSQTQSQQNQTVTMEMVPTYSINVTENQIDVITTYPIDIYINGLLHSVINPGFHTIFIIPGDLSIMVLPHEKY